MSVGPDPRSGSDYRAVLQSDYEASRFAYERIDATGLSLLGLTVTLCGFILLRLAHSCNIPAFTCKATVWPPLYAFVPIVPLALLLLFADLANARTVRAYYVRNLEREMRRLIGLTAADVSPKDDLPLTPAVYGDLNASLFGQRRGRLRYRVALSVTYLSVTVLLVSLTVLALRTARPVDVQLAAGIVYAGLYALLARLFWLGTIGSRRLWADALEAFTANAATEGPLLAPDHPRSLALYLVVPRPNELMARIPLVPIAYVLAACADDRFSIQRLVLSFAYGVVFEAVVYQGRYVVNDLRGLSSDAAFSPFKAANRFPSPATSRSVTLAFYCCLARLGVAVWIGVRGFGSVTFVVLVAGLVIETVVYERARRTVEVQGTEGEVAFARFSPAKILVYLLVGLGYALRGCVGIIASSSSGVTLGNLDESLWLQISAWWLFGLMTVTAAWSYVLTDQIVGEAPADSVRHAVRLSGHLGPLAHQAGLIRPTAMPLKHDTVSTEHEVSLRNKQVLEAGRFLTVWNLAFFALVPLLVLAVALGQASPPGHLAVVSITAFLFAVITAVVMPMKVPFGRRAVHVGSLTVVPASGAVLGVGYLVGLRGHTSIALALSVLVVLGVYRFFRLTSLSALQRSPRELAETIGRGYRETVEMAIRAVAGTAAADLVSGSQREHE